MIFRKLGAHLRFAENLGEGVKKKGKICGKVKHLPQVVKVERGATLSSVAAAQPGKPFGPRGGAA